MRVIVGALLPLLLLSSAASAQSLVVQGSAGPTLTDGGYSVAANVGFSPLSRLTVLFGVEQTHLFSRFTSDGRGGGNAFRGGTLTFASAELRATLLGRDRTSPYVFGGYGHGVSRPNVNERFPNEVTNTARVLFVGGGIQVPVRDRINIFGDVRLAFGTEGNDGIIAFVPVRVGVAWRF
jgi:hypothetical protein